MCWSAQSPDLNVIENIWLNIKRKLGYKVTFEVVVLLEVISCECASEVTSPEEVLTGSHGSDIMRMRGFSPRFFLTIVVVQNVGTSGHVTPKGFLWVRACATGFPPFFRFFWICCEVLHVRVLPGISKSTFDSLSHPIEGHSAFIQPCDWLCIYIKGNTTIIEAPFFKGVDVIEWSRALDVRLSEWCYSVSMVWIQIPSREEQKFDSSKI